MAREAAVEKVSKLKRNSFFESRAVSLPVLRGEKGNVSLVPIGPWILAETEIIKQMATWRKEAMSMFLAQFESTHQRTKRYLENLAISEQTRLLFLILLEEETIGHIGFSSISDSEAELDNVMKSSQLVFPGLMFEVSTALIDWGFRELELHSIHLQVTSHNESAQKLYSRLGFKVERRSPLRIDIQQDLTLHVPCSPEESDAPFQLVIMRLDRESWQAGLGASPRLEIPVVAEDFHEPAKTSGQTPGERL